MTASGAPGADFSLSGRVAVVTGGAGLLGPKHAEAIAAAGGIPVIADLRAADADRVAGELAHRFGVPAMGAALDVTDEASVAALAAQVHKLFGRVDILVNNAANNPRVEDGARAFARLESFSLAQWNADLAVGLTGAFLCARAFGTAMAQAGRGTIVNISSEYGVIGPDQRLYRVEGAADAEQPAKPVSYTAVKAGLHGLTLYLATYWAAAGVRVNTITVGGVENGQDATFLARAASRIPMGRMARAHEYQGALVYLCSDAASFVTGANLVVDGGKTAW
ncbi:MAG TPA: SDR family oxidoreductase [Gemmatimonadaceae bacterium]|nr:SDR family oxidoreductase [Gemmatimonadaceae bacterium]